MRVLFVLKQRLDYGTYSYAGGFSSGLLNSADFAAAMLSRNGFVTKVVEVVDNNSIDKEVTEFKADVVIIEALWVVPSKFVILQRLHPKVKWIIRVHSEAAFLAQEGIAIEWIKEYAKFENVSVAMNSKEGLAEVSVVYFAQNPPLFKLLYLPTYYPAPEHRLNHRRFKSSTIEIACMGAIRPLKNNLMQAMAAVQYAGANNLMLRFHINGTRVESGGNPVYENMLALFAGTRYELIQHPWMKHSDFLLFMASMDMGMQVSLSETFSIIAADTVSVGTPMVGSEAITWLSRHSQPDAITIHDIVRAMDRVINNPRIAYENLVNLRATAKEAEEAWLDVLR